MASSIDSACYFQQLPDLALEPIFEFMAPHNLLHLSLTSRKTFNLIQYMRTKATISLTFAPNKTTIHVKTSGNVQSEIIIGKKEESGEEICFDREFFSQCEKTQTGIVYPYGLEAVFPRLLRIYPRALIENINIALDGATSDEDYEALFQVLQMLQPKELENVRFETVNGPYTTKTIRPIVKIFEMFGSRVKLPELLTVEDGCDFPFADYLDMGLRSLRVKDSRMNDDDFNRIVRAWNASNNTQLQALIIGTSEAPFDANGNYLLTGLSRINGPLHYPEEGVNATHVMNMVRRHSDQKTAVFMRMKDEFSILS